MVAHSLVAQHPFDLRYVGSEACPDYHLGIDVAQQILQSLKPRILVVYGPCFLFGGKPPTNYLLQS